MSTFSAGRLSPSQFRLAAKHYRRTVGYVALGPFVFMFNLPKRWEKADPPPAIPVGDVAINIRKKDA